MPIYVQTKEKKIFPSIQLLRQVPTLIPSLSIFQNVDKFLKNGAHLMWPGIEQTPESFVEGDILSVSMSGRIIGVGQMLTGPNATKEGKAMELFLVETDWVSQEGKPVELELPKESQ